MTSLDWVASQACTLPTVEQPLRVAEFDALFAEHLVGVGRLAPTRVRLHLTAGASRDLDALTASLRDLTDRESQCCSFFTFSLTRATPRQAGAGEQAGDLFLDVEVPAARVDVLSALADRAQAVSDAAATDSGAAS